MANWDAVAICFFLKYILIFRIIMLILMKNYLFLLISVLAASSCCAQNGRQQTDTTPQSVIAEFIVLPSFEKSYGFSLLHDKSKDTYYVETIQLSDFDPDALFQKFPDNGVVVREPFELYRDSLRKKTVSGKDVARVAISKAFATRIYRGIDAKINEYSAGEVPEGAGDAGRAGTLVVRQLDGTKTILGLTDDNGVRWVSVHLPEACDDELFDTFT